MFVTTIYGVLLMGDTAYHAVLHCVFGVANSFSNLRVFLSTMRNQDRRLGHIAE